jgi:hypothetical protein
MSKKIDQNALTAAAQAATTKKLTNGSSRRGEEADQAEWDDVRAKACRLFLSDPDARVYLYYLASNGLSAALREYHAILCECIVLAESNASTPPVDAEAEEDIANKKRLLANQVSKTRSTFGEPNQTAIDELKRFAGAYLESSAKSFVRKRRAERRPRSKTDLSELLDEARIRELDVARRVSSLGNTFNLGSFLREGATLTILPALAATLRNPNITAEDEAMSIAASVGAYEAFSRDAAGLFMVHTGRQFPEPLTVSANPTYFRLIKSDKTEASASLLGVTSGMTVFSGQSSSVITQVDGARIYLQDPLVVDAGVIIRTAPQAALRDFIENDLYSASTAPSVDGLMRPFQMQKFSRPDAYKLVTKLLPIVTVIAPLTDEAARSVRVLGADVPPSGNYLETVSNFDPGVPRTSVRAADAILELLQTKGFDVVAEQLLRSNLDALKLEVVGEVRRSTDLAFMVGQYMNMLSPSLKL